MDGDLNDAADLLQAAGVDPAEAQSLAPAVLTLAAWLAE